MLASLRLLFFIILLLQTTNSYSAEFSQHDKSCHLDGEIRRGDEQKLEKIINSCHRLSLNSSGGSFSVALDIVEMIDNTATHVKEGDRCLSACAIIFMAGGYVEDSFYSVRIMERGAKIGFHRPYLKLDGKKNVYSAKVLEKVYNISIEEISRLLVFAKNNRFPMELLRRMLHKDGNEMYFINTVEDLIVSEISFELYNFNRYKYSSLRNVCDNYIWKKIHKYEYFPSRNSTRNIDGIIVNQKGKTFTRFNDYIVGEGDKLLCDVFENTVGYSIRLNWNDITATNFFTSVDSIFGLLLKTDTSNLKFDRKLRDLSVERQIQEPNNQTSSSKSARCYVIRSGTTIDNDPCNIVIENKKKLITYFVWPSGGKTVVEGRGNRVKINGVNSVGQNRVGFGTCYYNKETGNDFCYKID